jgi:hypothetical protein
MCNIICASYSGCLGILEVYVINITSDLGW